MDAVELSAFRREETDRQIRAISESVEAKGWPRYEQDPEICMERAFEFLTLLKEAGLR